MFFGFACREIRSRSANEDIDSYVASLSTQAVERAKSRYGVKLDYKPDSIKEAEKLLAARYEARKRQPLAENERY